MATARVGGLDIAYERAGAGPPLVFVHGAVADGRMWRPQLDALADEFTVIAWDEPGAGRSADLPTGFGLDGYADCLAGLIDALGLGPSHVAGLSWGTTVVLECYRRRPEVVGTLVLADGYAGWKGSLPADEVAARVEAVREALAHPGTDLTSTGLFAGDPPTRFAPLIEAMVADARPESLGPQVLTMAEADLRDVLPTVRVPTLLLWGASDARSPLSVARQFHDAVPGSELVVLPGAGHMSNLEAPQRFTETVRRFCRAHGLSAGREASSPPPTRGS